MEYEVCGPSSEMVATIAAAPDQGFVITMAFNIVEFLRPDGMLFVWEWVPEFSLWCLQSTSMGI